MRKSALGWAQDAAEEALVLQTSWMNRNMNEAIIKQLPRLRSLLRTTLEAPDDLCPECAVRHKHQRAINGLNLCDTIEQCTDELTDNAQQQLEEVLEFVIKTQALGEQVN